MQEKIVILNTGESSIYESRTNLKDSGGICRMWKFNPQSDDNRGSVCLFSIIKFSFNIEWRIIKYNICNGLPISKGQRIPHDRSFCVVARAFAPWLRPKFSKFSLGSVSIRKFWGHSLLKPFRENKPPNFSQRDFLIFFIKKRNFSSSLMS